MTMSFSSTFTSTSSTSGITATVAVDVCTRPCALALSSQSRTAYYRPRKRWTESLANPQKL
jgi:hypothetical protein